MGWAVATRHFSTMFGRSVERLVGGEPAVESALKQAFAAANGKDVRIAGGPATVRAYLKAGLLDELHLVQVPVLFGQGERIFEDMGGVESIYECVEFTPSAAVSHLRIVKKAR